MSFKKAVAILAGYSKDSLSKITQTHLDVVSPKTDSASGYVIFAVDKMGYFAIVDTQ
ncbi:MAG: hypothetical protein GQ581_08185 [Methyloprofundus sp.]|nr:hypothetical protein [Methyloprofundus sp.]